MALTMGATQADNLDLPLAPSISIFKMRHLGPADSQEQTWRGDLCSELHSDGSVFQECLDRAQGPEVSRFMVKFYS